MHVSILDHIRHLNFDLLDSLKVKFDSVTALPIYGFLFMFNSNGLTQLLYEIEAFEIWVTLTLTFQGHLGSNVTVSFDLPYMLSY